MLAESPHSLVERAMAALSDVGRHVPPSEAARVATFIPPSATDINEFYTPIHPVDAWSEISKANGTGGMPKDVVDALKPLLKLQSQSHKNDPHIQGIYEALYRSTVSSCKRHCRAFQTCRTGSIEIPCSCDVELLFEHLMSSDEAKRHSEVADRWMPLPSYDSNKGIEESDISAYPDRLLVDHRWGRGLYTTAEDAVGASDEAGDVAPSSSIHAKGGLTWMQKALTSQAPTESVVSFLSYREHLMRAMGGESAASARVNAVTHADRDCGSALYADQVLAVTKETVKP